MSFDVKEAWRRIRGWSKFTKIAPVLTQLWHDPVWSKVIASGILALIGFSWYFLATFYSNHAILPAQKHAATVPPAVSNFWFQATQGNFCFDYSKNNGVYAVGNDDAIFRLRFSKADDTTIYLYSDDDKIARAKNVKKGETIRFGQFDNTSRVYEIHLGELFMARNENGYFMQGRVLSIKDDTRGAEADGVCVQFQIGINGEGKFRAL